LRPAAEYAYVTAADALLWMGRSDEALLRLKAGLKEIPGSNVLRSLTAYAAWASGDRPTSLTLIRELEGAWPSDHSNTVLLAGLKRVAEGDPASARVLFETYRTKIASSDLAAKKHNEKRVLSVNLYFMAQMTAKLGDQAGGKVMVSLADRLHPGKLRVAQQDPAFR
jgi:hypothetical protein